MKSLAAGGGKTRGTPTPRLPIGAATARMLRSDGRRPAGEGSAELRGVTVSELCSPDGNGLSLGARQSDCTLEPDVSSRAITGTTDVVGQPGQVGSDDGRFPVRGAEPAHVQLDGSATGQSKDADERTPRPEPGSCRVLDRDVDPRCVTSFHDLHSDQGASKCKAVRSGTVSLVGNRPARAGVSKVDPPNQAPADPSSDLANDGPGQQVEGFALVDVNWNGHAQTKFFCCTHQKPVTCKKL